MDDSPSAALATALQVQGALSCEARPIHAGMAAWNEQELTDYFCAAPAAGPLAPQSQEQNPAEKRPAAPGIHLFMTAAPDAPRPIFPPLPKFSSGRPDSSVREDEWRRNHLVRKTHWFCATCNLALPREMACCAQCGCADFSSSDLDYDGVQRLATRLPGCAASLTSLDVSHNPLGSTGVGCLARALRELPHLTRLNVAGTSASDAGVMSLMNALADGAPPLRDIGLTGCSVKDAGAASVAELLLRPGTLPYLINLGLGWNRIRGSAARELAKAVLLRPHVDNFCGLPIGTLRRGALPPVPPLSERDKLRRPIIDPSEELHLQGCGCGPSGAYVIAALLPRLPPLKAVVLPYQDLGDDGVVALAEAAAAACPSLDFLMLSRNDVGHAAAERVQELFPHLDATRLRINNRGA